MAIKNRLLSAIFSEGKNLKSVYYSCDFFEAGLEALKMKRT